MVSSSDVGDVINNCESSGRVAKWGLELMGFNINYAPCTAIKSWVRTDFVAEWTKE